MPKLPFTHYLALVLMGVLLLLPQLVTAQTRFEELPSLSLLVPAPIPVISEQADPDAFLASVSAQALVAIDVPSAAILLNKQAETPVPPASTTKLLTALVARELYDLDTTLTMNAETDPGGTTARLVVGRSYAVRDILSALLVSSGNDAATVLAYYHPEGVAGFVTAMNQKAQDLHLTNTRFSNASGLDEEAHVSTARDLGVVARAVMRDEVLRELVQQETVTFADVTGEIVHTLHTTNALLGVEEGVVGIKTGTTQLAGETLITQVERNGRTVLLVILGSQDRYLDTRLVLKWITSHFHWLERETLLPDKEVE